MGGLHGRPVGVVLRLYPAAAFLYRAGNLPQEDTGDGGWWVWGYTAQFGGGFSATLSAEERRTAQIIDFSGAAGALGGVTTPGTNGTILAGNANAAGYGGWQSPDVVANLRVDQAWGSAQVMGALHQDNAGYYGAPRCLAVLAISGAGSWAVDLRSTRRSSRLATTSSAKSTTPKAP